MEFWISWIWISFSFPRLGKFSESQCFLEGSLTHGWCPGFYAWYPSFHSCHPEGLILVARRACIPGSHRTMAIGKMTLRRPPPPGHCTDKKLRHIPKSFSEGSLLLYLRASAWGASFRIGTI